MNNVEYWTERSLMQEKRSRQQGDRLLSNLKKEYVEAQKNLQEQMNVWYEKYADEKGISIAQAKKKLTAREYRDHCETVEQCIEKAKTGDPKYDDMLRRRYIASRVSRLQALQDQVSIQLELLGKSQDMKTFKLLQEVYKDTFTHTAQTVSRGIKGRFDRLDTKAIERICQTPWSGKSFSERIWGNNKKLISEVRHILAQGAVQGSSIEKMSRQLAQRMKVDYNRAECLIRTETAYIRGQATADSYGELGIEQYEYLATLDNRTSAICRSLDKKVFTMKERMIGVNYPPMHPRCRSTTIPYFPEDSILTRGETRAARDENGKTVLVDGSLNYNQWQSSGEKALKVVAEGVRIEVAKTLKDLLLEKQAKVDALKEEYASLMEINERYHMRSTDFLTTEDKEAWRAWKKEIEANGGIENICDRLQKNRLSLSRANGELAKTRLQLLKEGAIEFTPAKTIEEANLYAKNVLGVNAEYKGLDIRAANEWNQGLTNMKIVFPELVENNFKFVGEAHARNAIAKQIAYEVELNYLRTNLPKGFSDDDCQNWAKKKASEFVRKVLRIRQNQMASSWSPQPPFESCRGICMNKGFYNDYDKALKSGLQQVETKWHPEGCFTVKATFDHEFAHQLDDWLKIGEEKNIQALFDMRTTTQLTEELSEYAWNNQNPNRYSEMIAEAWSEYCNNPTPRSIAVEVGETIERTYVEWAKKNL